MYKGERRGKRERENGCVYKKERRIDENGEREESRSEREED